MRQPETTQQWLDHYDNLRQQADDNYQQTGEPRYYTAQWKYECICRAFRALIDKEHDDGAEMRKRQTNAEYNISLLTEPTYTREEVAAMLRKAVWW